MQYTGIEVRTTPRYRTRRAYDLRAEPLMPVLYTERLTVLGDITLAAPCAARLTFLERLESGSWNAVVVLTAVRIFFHPSSLAPPSPRVASAKLIVPDFFRCRGCGRCRETRGTAITLFRYPVIRSERPLVVRSPIVVRPVSDARVEPRLMGVWTPSAEPDDLAAELPSVLRRSLSRSPATTAAVPGRPPIRPLDTRRTDRPTCACACVHVCMCACVHVCMCAYVHVCMCMCACVHVH